jgi:hypothetical protein
MLEYEPARAKNVMEFDIVNGLVVAVVDANDTGAFVVSISDLKYGSVVNIWISAEQLLYEVEYE